MAISSPEAQGKTRKTELEIVSKSSEPIKGHL
jgi:hypothetical protein